MKVHTIEIAAAIEEELKRFLTEWGGGYPMRFTRFVDIGGRQTDLHVYQAEKGVPPWMTIRIKSVMRTEQGECIQYFAQLVESGQALEEVLVSPEIWKLPALADKVLAFCRATLLGKIGGGSGLIDEGSADRSAAASLAAASEEEAEDDYAELDTSGILAGSGEGNEMDFNPEDIIAQANSGSDSGADELEEVEEDDDFGFNPEDAIKD